MTFIPLFSRQNIFSRVDDFVGQSVEQLIEAMAFIGEEFINKARESGGYRDRTGNLRASVFYQILADGRDVGQVISSASTDDNSYRSSVNSLINELKGRFSTGIVLIVGAGMEYAVYVEALGIDVISGSAPSRSEVRMTLNTLLNG